MGREWLRHFDRLDGKVPLLDAGCHGKVPLLGAMWWGAIAGCHCWMPWMDANSVPLMLPLLDATLTDWAWCHCWVPCGKVPLLGGRQWAGSGYDTLTEVPLLLPLLDAGCHGKVPLLGAMWWGAIAGCH